MPRGEPIAIVGMACRFPGAPDVDAFARMLREGRDAIGEPPAWRRELLRVADGVEITTLRGGYIEGVDLFEPEFFGISGREAAEMDPQQRLALEVTYEALVDAGIEVGTLRNRGVSVFLGVSQTDYGRRLLERGEVSAYAGMQGVATAAGRIAYWLGTRGPCMAVDTACSSSLTAIHLAVRALRNGECEMALAGGVQLNLFSEMLVFLTQAKALAPDGRSKAFDAAADGYGRGEGCGMLALKRLKDAERDGDRVWAVIRGSAVNHDGPSSGFTVPNGLAQRELIEAALRDAELEPREVQFLEAHGTGTLLGDPIELDAAGGVYSLGRAKGERFVVGSVKASIGHLEAAAGVAGVMKAVLAVKDGFVPAQPAFGEANPRVPWERFGMQAAVSGLDWPHTDGLRKAAVSAFGLTGSNAHLILEQAAEREVRRKTVARHEFRRRQFWMREAAGLWDAKVTSPLMTGVLYRADMSGERLRLLEEHKVSGKVVVPGAYYLAWAAAASGGVLEKIVFPQAFAPEGGERLDLLVEDGRFRVASSTGAVPVEGVVGERGAAPERVDLGAVLARCTRAAGDFYGGLTARGIGLGERFRWLADVRLGEGEAVARIAPQAKDGMSVPPGLVDACFQLFSPVLADRDSTLAPWRVGRCELFAETLESAAWMYVKLPGAAEILDAERRVLLRLTGIELRALESVEKTRPFAYCAVWEEVDEASLSEVDAVVFAPEGETTAATLVELAGTARNTGGKRLVVAAEENDGLLRGFARCLAAERPELRVVLTEGQGIRGKGQELLRAAGGAGGSAWRRVHKGRVEAARVARLPLGKVRALPLRGDRTYLVTGGTGFIGRKIAEFLRKQGAGRVVTAGRSGGDFVCDVSDAAAVRALVEKLPDLRGVVHAAGVRWDGFDLTADEMECVIAGKARGAWNLHEATRRRELDFFVMVSSSAGVLGSPGQAAYGAANAELDALAVERKRMGLPAVSVAWGPWANAGMFAGMTEAQAGAWRARGVTPLKAEDALRDLGAIVASGEANVLYLDVNWERLARMWGADVPEFLRGLVAGKVEAAREESDWRELAFAEAEARMTGVLRAEVMRVLALDRAFAARTPFFDLGMDSLLALELRNRLQARFGMAIPATLLFDCPSLEPLTAWMLEQVGVKCEESPEALSEQELERLLAAKIEELEARGLR